MESPSRSLGTGAGTSIFGTAGDNAQVRAIPAALCFGYGLSCGREADVWRADYATLLHLRLQII
jgi:hypothetical protein